MSRLTPLIEATSLRARVKELAAEIREATGDVSLTVVGVLRGALPFTADLVRELGGDVIVDLVAVRSYSGMASTGTVELMLTPLTPLTGRHVVVVEDIVDSGHTLAMLREHIASLAPASLRVAALLDKPSRREVTVPVEHVGFTIEDHFVVGYGLDLDQRYRHLPDVCVFHPDDT